ncbi:MAG: hypothetical protein ACUVX8_02740 [Candidatus Zipacnadales bacterium]
MYFAPKNSCAGMVAAIGVLFVSGLALVATLPGAPAAGQLPPWLVWILRLSPLPAVILLWAVASESEFKVKTDRTGISFRRSLGGVTRVPWREVTDYFADCGRTVREICATGGSLTHEVSASRPTVPFAEYHPEFVLMSGRGEFVLDELLTPLDRLTTEIVVHAPSEAPRRWEEATWLCCKDCGESFAVSLWPIPEEQMVATTTASTCPYCEADLSLLLSECPQPMLIEFRGFARRRIKWRPTISVAELAETPLAFGPPEEKADEAQAGPESR